MPIAFEYFNIAVDTKDEGLYSGCYQNFGWELTKSKATFASTSDAIEDRVLLKFKRGVNLRNKDEINALQAKCEDSLKAVARLKLRKTALVMSVSIALGILVSGVVAVLYLGSWVIYLY